MVKDIFAEAGIEGKKSNHSLRVAGATSLFSAGVPERIIQSRTGHSSVEARVYNILLVEALRKYERISENQEIAVSKILTCEKDSFEVLPDTVKADTVKEVFPVSEVSPVSVSSSKLPSRAPVQYNNCTINVNYSASPNFGNIPQYTSPYPYPDYMYTYYQ